MDAVQGMRHRVQRRFFYAVALPLLVGAIGMALKVMPAKGTSWLVHLDVGLAWFSALSAMVLVPTDVSTTLEVLICLHSISQLLRCGCSFFQKVARLNA